MKSPEGLIWNTPSRRRPFRRDYRDANDAEMEQILNELEAEEARMFATGQDSEPPRLRVVRRES